MASNSLPLGSFRWFLFLRFLFLRLFLGCLLLRLLLRHLFRSLRLSTNIWFLLISCLGLLFWFLGRLLLLSSRLLLLCWLLGFLFQFWLGLLDRLARLLGGRHYGLYFVLLLFLLKNWLLLLILGFGSCGFGCLHVGRQFGGLDWLLFPGLCLDLACGLEVVQVHVGVLLNGLCYLSTALPQSLIMWPKTRKALREYQLNKKQMFKNKVMVSPSQ